MLFPVIRAILNKSEFHSFIHLIIHLFIHSFIHSFEKVCTIKARLMAQGAASTANAAGAAETVVYNGLIDGFRRTIAKEGPFAVYKVRTHTTNEHTHTQTSYPITMPAGRVDV